MRTIRVAATAVALGLLLSGTALAQTGDPTTPPSSSTTTTSRTTDSGSTVTGKVTNVNLSGRSFTVESSAGTMTFYTNSSTAIKAAMPDSPAGSMGSAMPGPGTTGSMGTLSNLKVGDQVQVAYSGSSGGTATATSIEVMSPTRAGTQESLGSMTGSVGTTGSTYGSTGTTATGSTTGSTYPSTGSTGSTTGSTYGQTGTTGSMTGSAATTTGATGSMTGPTTGTTRTTTSPSTGMVGTSVMGTVVSVDPASNTVTVQTSNGRETFHADTNSRFLASGRTVQLRELKAGDTVTLNFTTTGADRMISRGEVTQGTRSASAVTTPSTTTTTTSPTSTYDADETDDLPATASPTFAVLTTGLVLLMSGLALRRRRRA